MRNTLLKTHRKDPFTYRIRYCGLPLPDPDEGSRKGERESAVVRRDYGAVREGKESARERAEGEGEGEAYR